MSTPLESMNLPCNQHTVWNLVPCFYFRYRIGHEWVSWYEHVSRLPLQITTCVDDPSGDRPPFQTASTLLLHPPVGVRFPPGRKPLTSFWLRGHRGTFIPSHLVRPPPLPRSNVDPVVSIHQFHARVYVRSGPGGVLHHGFFWLLRLFFFFLALRCPLEGLGHCLCIVRTRPLFLFLLSRSTIRLPDWQYSTSFDVPTHLASLS